MNLSRYLIVIAVIAAATVPTLSLISNACAGAKRPAAAADFESSPGYEKLDLRLRETWRDSPSSKKTVECIMKAHERITEDDKAAIAAAGFNARTVIGTIVTGNLRVRDVPEVANLPFIQVMEQAVPMSLKKPKS